MLASILALGLLALLPPAGAAADATLPSGFRESTPISGLNVPTNVEFSKDGRVFVAEKSGVIKVFDGLSDTTPTTFADLSTNVHDYSDRGLLGLALDPGFPEKPYVYALYTYDHELGSSTPAPRWRDDCPSPPGATDDGCVVSGRLSRLTADGNAMSGAEKVLIEDWCQQYPSHSVGDLAFGRDGALYVSGGDGASFTFPDYGQGGGTLPNTPTPKNPCGDPPSGRGGDQEPPSAEGGSLRSQDLRTPGDPTSLDGAILRVDPATGNALPDNPRYDSSDPNARRIVGYGFRNPFRIATRPGTDEVWSGNVGWYGYEEINRIAKPTGSSVGNFGWPCYEGSNWRQEAYDGPNLKMCEDLYNSGASAVTAPFYSYEHGQPVVPGESSCQATNGSSTSGLAFYNGGPYPDSYDGALFFADYARGCIWTMKKGADGQPDPATRETFASGAATPVDLEVGPEGDLFYVDIGGGGGTIRRIQYDAGADNRPPTAVAEATPTSGGTPLTVNFDGSGSSDPEGDALSYAWDLDGDGAYDDSASAKPSYTYQASGNYAVKLRTTDGRGASDESDPLTISAGNNRPTATIDRPTSATTYKTGDTIDFSGSATDSEDGTLPPAALSWSVIIYHCVSAGGCHEHPLQTFDGVSSGSFVVPDHEGTPPLELRLTATDSGGSEDTESVRLDPTGKPPTTTPPNNTVPQISSPRPAPGSKTRSRTPSIAATVRDAETDLAKSDITLSIDGSDVADFSYDRATDRLSYASKRLSRGRHTVKVVARDEQGLEETQTWGFKVVRRR